MPATKTPDKELETADIPGVEIMAEGTWNGDEYTRDDLDAMVSAFDATRGKIDPPVKLGHDDGQKMAQADGYPALGWVDRLYRKGSTLIADLRGVPKAVAKIITAGGYQKVSSEIYFDKEVDGVTHRRILKAISLLGGDMPAVKDIRSIGDISGLYEEGLLVALMAADDGDEPSTTLVFLREAKHAAMGGDKKVGDPEPDEDDVLTELADVITRMEAKIAGKNGAKRARVFMATTLASLKAMQTSKNTEDEMDVKKLAEQLGLAADATEDQVTAKIAELAKTPEAKPEDGTKIAALTEQVITLTRERAQEKAYAEVDAALKAGKFVPAQAEMLREYAVRDAEGFAKFVAATPKLAILSGPIGGEGDAPEETPEVAAATKDVAKAMGVSKMTLEGFGTKTTAELMEEWKDKQGSAGLTYSKTQG